ncbi:MAG: hypothetical protein QM628_13850 [Propionicimonas sp.]
MTETTPAGDALAFPDALRRLPPRTEPELNALIRDLLSHSGFAPGDLDGIGVEAELRWPDIPRLTLTASGIPLPSQEPPAAELPQGAVEEVAARLGEARVVGRELRWEKAGFDATLDSHDLELRWLLQAGEVVGIRFAEVARGSVRVETDLDALVESIRITAERSMRGDGVDVRFRKLQVRATELGEGGYRVRVDAAARWKLLPLSVRLDLVATLHDDLTLRFTEVRASSANPLCAIALIFGRKHLHEGMAEPVPVRELLGPEVTSLSLRLQPRLTLAATFGAP